jgi:hypothetical protein
MCVKVFKQNLIFRKVTGWSVGDYRLSKIELGLKLHRVNYIDEIYISLTY